MNLTNLLVGWGETQPKLNLLNLLKNTNRRMDAINTRLKVIVFVNKMNLVTIVLCVHIQNETLPVILLITLLGRSFVATRNAYRKRNYVRVRIPVHLHLLCLQLSQVYRLCLHLSQVTLQRMCLHLQLIRVNLHRMCLQLSQVYPLCNQFSQLTFITIMINNIILSPINRSRHPCHHRQLFRPLLE